MVFLWLEKLWSRLQTGGQDGEGEGAHHPRAFGCKSPSNFSDGVGCCVFSLGIFTQQIVPLRAHLLMVPILARSVMSSCQSHIAFDDDTLNE